MFIKQHKINLILNQNLPLFGILLFCGVIYLTITTSYWFLLFLMFVPLSFIKHKVSWQQWVIIAIVILFFVLLTIFIPNFSLIDLINKRPMIVRKGIINFFDKYYDKEISIFIKLILLNIKSKESWVFYRQTVDLGVVWLICISGFHISLISKIINWFFRSKPRLGKYINMLIISFYSFLLNFSYASLRILFKLFYNHIFYKFKIKNFNKLGLIGITLAILNPNCFTNYGFLLSFLICLITYFVMKFELNNKILNSIIINILASVVTVPFLIEINHKISLLTFINSFIFGYFSPSIFLYFLFFGWLPFMSIVHHGIMIAIYVLVGNISFVNVFIYSNTWPIWGCFIFYFGLITIVHTLYLIVINNKI